MEICSCRSISGRNAKDRYSTTVAECRFDGKELVFVKHGNVLRLDVARGLYEPSLIAFGDSYYLTMRNDVRGYASKATTVYILQSQYRGPLMTEWNSAVITRSNIG